MNPTLDDLPAVLQHYADAAAAAYPAPPSRVIVQPGAEVAWDACCPDGQLWSRVVRIEPYVGNPTLANGMPCGVMWYTAILAVGLIRCVAVVDDRGRAPSAEKVTNDGLKIAADVGILGNVIICDPLTSAFGQYTPLGPQGGCAGGEWEFTVRLYPCGCA